MLSLKNVRLAAMAPSTPSISWEMEMRGVHTVVAEDETARRELGAIVSALAEPKSGEVRFMGHPLGNTTREQWRMLGIESTLWREPWHRRLLDKVRPPTFLEKVSRAARGASAAEIATGLDRFGIWNRQEVRIGRHPANTAQRCELAAMWVRHPKLMVLMNPFSGLDPALVRQLHLMLVEAWHLDGICSLILEPDVPPLAPTFLHGDIFRLDGNGLQAVIPADEAE